MCGIAAVIGQNGFNSADRARAAIAALSHRGPDGLSLWESSSGRVCLAHARLSTTDLNGWRGSLTSEDGLIVAAVNGEFYGWRVIRSQLEGLGHRFKTERDSEILIHLYEEHGPSCVAQLEGEFAFALWDEAKQLLFAARDRFGTKPLYYVHSGCETLIASEVKAFQRAGEMLAWDEQGFIEQLVFQSCLGGQTIFKGVKEVLPGHYILQRGTALENVRYWDLDYGREEELQSCATDDDYSEQLLSALDSAVRTRMISEIPAACYVSGGIDSNAILSLMSRHSRSPVEAFCVSFDDPAVDEFAVAERSAEFIGAKLNRVAVTSASLAADFRNTVRHCENLLSNANSAAKYSLSRAVRDAGFRVVLCGEGSDELFAGYPHFVADSLRSLEGAEREVFRSMSGLSFESLERMLYPAGRRTTSVSVGRLGYTPMSVEGNLWILASLRAILPAGISERMIESRLLDSIDVAGQLSGRSTLNQSLYLHTKTCLPAVTLSSLGDRVEMAHSVESRLPFLDCGVVNLARQLPRSQKVRFNVDKYVLRKALRSVVLPEICGRPKQPMTAPAALWKRTSAFGQLLQDTLRSSSLDRLPFIDKHAARRLLDDAPADETMASALEAPFTALASACVLAEELRLS